MEWHEEAKEDKRALDKHKKLNHLMNVMMNKLIVIISILFLKFNGCLSQTSEKRYVYFKMKAYNIDDSLDMKNLMNRVRKIISNEHYFHICFQMKEGDQVDTNSVEKINIYFNLISEELRDKTGFTKKIYSKKRENLFFRKKKKLLMTISRLNGKASIYPANLEKYFRSN